MSDMRQKNVINKKVDLDLRMIELWQKTAPYVWTKGDITLEFPLNAILLREDNVEIFQINDLSHLSQPCH